MRIHEKTKQDVADNQHGSGSLCLGRSLTTLPEKERPKIEQREESEQKEPNLEEANQPTEPEEPVASVPQVPVPKTGDFWW